MDYSKLANVFSKYRDDFNSELPRAVIETLAVKVSNELKAQDEHFPRELFLDECGIPTHLR